MFNPTRLKVQLKLSINRLKMLQGKKNSLNQHQRRDIATLLEKHKVESARIRVEHIIREDLVMEAMEILELYCDLLLARFGLLEQYKECDPGIAEAVNTIIWASARTSEVKELSAVRDQLGAKFGKEFLLAAMENTDDVVSPRVLTKLQVNAPDPFLVERYLEEIAKTYDVSWQSDILVHEENSDTDDDASDNGGQAEIVPQAALEPPLTTDNILPDVSSDLD
ncbi:regulator of Vps4 activity in the MVB pathway-domain-containing protein [Chlamydoabsidia padenii]|nr:regulator of Vps4 activity in the MVB pathway-domain-containing protein [Chlamydoabsidia padenii]